MKYSSIYYNTEESYLCLRERSKTLKIYHSEEQIILF